LRTGRPLDEIETLQEPFETAPTGLVLLRDALGASGVPVRFRGNAFATASMADDSAESMVFAANSRRWLYHIAKGATPLMSSAE